jgi:cation-transporting ATPase 13A2
MIQKNRFSQSTLSLKSFQPITVVFKIVATTNIKLAHDEKARMLVSTDVQNPGSVDIDGLKIPVTFLPTEYRTIQFYADDMRTQLRYYILSIVSLGILPLVSYWYPRLLAFARYVPVSELHVSAQFVLLEHYDCHAWTLTRLQRDDDSNSGSFFVWFEYRKQRYVFDSVSKEFQRLSASLHSKSLASFRPHLSSGIDTRHAGTLQRIFGLNAIDLGVMPLRHVILNKILHPFYLFQIISVCLWLIEEYVTYSMLILVMSIVSIAYEVSAQVTNMTKLQTLVKMDFMVEV